MAIYDYRGLNAHGKNVRGIVDAPNVGTAREKLKGRGLYLQEIAEVTKKKSFSLTIPKRRTVTSLITRQLSFLLSAQLPIINALDAVIDQTEDREVKKMMIDIREKIKEGQSVSLAFAAYPRYFNQMYVNTLHAGEISGKLDQVLMRLSEMYEKSGALIARLRSTLTYPIFMFFFALIIIIFLVSFIVPTFARLFADFGQVLPLPTRILIGTTEFISRGWWGIAIFIAILLLLFRRIYRGERGRLYFDRLVLRLPLAGKLIQDTFKIRFSYTMSLMLANGIGIIEALESVRGIFRNQVFTDSLSHAIEMVRKGEKLSRALAQSPVFNTPLLGMIGAGEMGDRVPEVLDSIGRNLEVDLTGKVDTLTALAEPILIVFVGVCIGFAILSIMLPIFQINQLF
jgi:general secretion pathway protein F